MDRTVGTSAQKSEPAEPSDHVSLDAANGGTLTEEGPVTRRRVLSASAAFAAATVAVAGGANAAQARAAGKKNAPAKPASGGKGITITVNGRRHTSSAAPDTPLLYILRDELQLRGPKFGCGLSECGACAVLRDGKQIRSCILPLNKVGSAPVVTLDGLAASYHGEAAAEKGAMHPVQKAWIDEQVPQCGYCQSGMMIQAADLLSKNPNPSTAEIKTAMNGHLCRCGTYNSIIAGIHSAAKEMQKK
jgi:aerobic-type carbon monoxide dehydrogenase small subunit (CoxS/CutS family)